MSDTDYDLRIHDNPSAEAWAKFYCECRAKSPDPTNFDTEENMIGWFANAMMAMHDHLKRENATPQEPPHGQEFTADTL